MKRTISPIIEPLESRIAPAITIANPLFDIKAGVGQTGVSLDLGTLVDATSSFRTIVQFTTNFTAPGASSAGVIRLELFDDKTPLTVQNFLSYVKNLDDANDYDGTYFHRLVNGFVLQGGGYNPQVSVNNFGPHVATPFQVHNEFFGDDTSLDPITGTIAMAKVGTSAGGGPNSGTSEFFINYADNSSILDTQNGGFTVFGKVIQGMDIVNAIANLRKVPVNNLGGSNASEGIPTTAGNGVALTNDTLIKIVSATVIAPTAANANGHTFAVEIVDNVTGAPSTLLTSSLDATNKLQLNYANGKAGVAKVKVTVSKGAETPVVDEFLVTVLPNLVSSVTTSIGSPVVPGQTGTASVKITNNGGGFAKGDVSVRLFLSEATNLNSDIASGFTLEETGANADIEITAGVAQKFSLASGGSLTVPVKYEITPADAALLKIGSQYRLLAKVESPDGATMIQELFTDDNVGNISEVSEFRNAFGNLGTGRSGTLLTLAEDSDVSTSDQLTLILKGPGSGDVTRTPDGLMNITLSGTTSASSFSIKTPKGAIADIGEVHITGAIGKVNLGNANLLSHFSASAGAKSIVLGDLGAAAPTESSTFDIGGLLNLKTKVVFGTVRDFNFRSEIPISSLTAKEWLNSNAAEVETLTFNGLGKLAIKSNLEANLDERGNLTVGSVFVGGDIVDSNFTTRTSIKKLVAGNVTDSAFQLGNAAQVAALSSAKGTILFKEVNNTSLAADYPISALTAATWTNTAATDLETLEFHGLGVLKIAGALQANLTESSGLAVKSITVLGEIKGATIHSTGDLTALTAGTLTDTTITAGVSAKPAALADLANARNIGSITVKTALSNSTIVAAQIAKASVAGVAGDSGTGKFGFYADAIKSYVRVSGSVLKNLDAAGVQDTVGANYEVRIF